MPLSYVLPIKDKAPQTALDGYLAELARLVDDVIVVDGSDAAVFAAHSRSWGDRVRHVPVDADLEGVFGKVLGVVTGLRHAHHERVVVADDDVRHTRSSLARMAQLLEDADAVVPQNVFEPAPWHARWDTARSLLNRAVHHDYPGTLGVRRTRVLAAGGYDADVLFENLELLRTVRASGGTVVSAPDLFVARRPCSTRHFLTQRVRQAYDGFAQPLRLAVELALLPAAVTAFRRFGPRGPAALALGGVAMAEVGRRRAGGRRVWPPTASLWAPAWLAERAVCAWLALACRIVLGGAPYPGVGVVRRAATPQRALARRLADRARPYDLTTRTSAPRESSAAPG